MKIFVEKENRMKQMKFKGTTLILLKKLKINPEEVIVVKNNELVGLDENLVDKDSIKILSVVSGG
jgi:sulfur carrier protein ThiS